MMSRKACLAGITMGGFSFRTFNLLCPTTRVLSVYLGAR